MESDLQRARLIRISAPSFNSTIEEAVIAVLRSGHVAQGPVVAELEALFSAMTGAKYAVAVSNGTAALEACLEVLNIGPGDEVITSPLTFAATLNAILHVGATARFADVAPDFTIDPNLAINLIEERTRVLMPVDLYGLMADMRAIGRAARQHGLFVIEDAAQAHGARQSELRAGGTGLGCFSLYATKNVTSAEGGMVTTSDSAVAHRLRLLRNQGMEGRYDYVSVGRNLRLTDLAAAVAVPQMRRLNEVNAARVKNARKLTELLSTCHDDLVLPTTPEDRTHVWHQYTVLLPEGVDRRRVIGQLAEQGIESGVYYPRLVWDYRPYRDHPRVRCDPTPRAANIVRRCLSLPVHPGLGSEDLERIGGGLRKAIRRSELGQSNAK